MSSSALAVPSQEPGSWRIEVQQSVSFRRPLFYWIPPPLIQSFTAIWLKILRSGKSQGIPEEWKPMETLNGTVYMQAARFAVALSNAWTILECCLEPEREKFDYHLLGMNGLLDQFLMCLHENGVDFLRKRGYHEKRDLWSVAAGRTACVLEAIS